MNIGEVQSLLDGNLCHAGLKREPVKNIWWAPRGKLSNQVHILDKRLNWKDVSPHNITEPEAPLLNSRSNEDSAWETGF